MTANRPQPRPEPRPGVLDLEPYVPGKSGAPGVARVFKLSANETPLGPSPKAIEAFRSVAGHLEDYPEGTARLLREAIGKQYGLDPARIICGAGSDDLLNLIGDAYLKDGDEAIYPKHGFLVYPIATLGSGATPIVAEEKEHTADVDAILAKVSDRTKVVWIANPNNPTGTYIPYDELKRLQRSLPPHVLLVVDAAYSEYVRRNDYDAGIELVATCNNVVMTRTFSKIYGLAALRVGWMYGPAARHRRDQPHPRAVQCQHAGDDGRDRGDQRHRAYGNGARPQRAVARLADRRGAQARPQGDAERRQLPADPLPEDQGQDGGGGR